MIHEWHFSMLELQPVELLVSTPTSRIAALSDLVVGEHEAEDRASQMALWHARFAASLFARHCFR